MGRASRYPPQHQESLGRPLHWLALQSAAGSAGHPLAPLQATCAGPSPRSSHAPPELSTGGLLGHPPSFSPTGTSHGININKTERCCWHPGVKPRDAAKHPTEPGRPRRGNAPPQVSTVWWSRSPGPASWLCFCLLCNLELLVPRPPFSHLQTGLVEVKLIPGQV